jgi:hypothetical protein
MRGRLLKPPGDAVTAHPPDVPDPLTDLLDQLRRERFTPSPGFCTPVDEPVDDSEAAQGRRRRALEQALNGDADR